MHTIAKSRLRSFWESHSGYADAISPLTEWYRHMEKSQYRSPQEIKADFASASILKGGRVVFKC